jgi:hypothetical protein
MALNKLKYNSLNITPVANKAISFDSDPDALEATLEPGSMTFIKKLTASSDSTLSFIDGSSNVVLDNTYKEYIFIFNNIHPSSDGDFFSFQGNAAGGSGFNETITSSSFRAYQNEAGDDTALAYYGTNDFDLAQSTNFQVLGGGGVGADNDQCLAGSLHLFNPSSTTFVKHFISRVNIISNSNYQLDGYQAGYFNTTSAIDEIQFKMASGAIDSGTITLYGIN